MSLSLPLGPARRSAIWAFQIGKNELQVRRCSRL
jgi:hypothetical protein